MKTNLMLILIFFSALSCMSKNPYVLEKNQPIIFDNPTYQQSRILLNGINATNAKTIYLLGEKEYTLELFAKKIKNAKDSYNYESITDKATIEKMGYSPQKINRIVIAKK